MSDLLPLREMAAEIGVSDKQFRIDIKERRIPFLQIGKRKQLFDRVEVAHIYGDLSLLSERPRREREAFTYLVWARGSNFYKIGVATDPSRRLAELAVGCPFSLEFLAVIPSRITSERELHERFAAYRERGEWFKFPTKRMALQPFGKWDFKYYQFYIRGHQ